LVNVSALVLLLLQRLGSLDRPAQVKVGREY
jgi:hypothetical protein